jgi:predicted transposase/invertase (TIGR01784 family)
MQAVRKDDLPRRARYYHSQIDMELLVSGAEYTELPNSYVIFICDFDPFEKGKYRYTFQNKCNELQEFSVDDGIHTIFLNTKGKNAEEVPKELVKFLKFVGADLQESTEDYEDEFVKELQKSVAHVKTSREMEERFMLLELMLKDEHKAGKIEGKIEASIENLLELLEELSVVPENLRKTIMEETDLSTLKKWLKLAAKSSSIEQFMENM